MKIFYTTQEMPLWVKMQIEDGNTLICNAPRPLWGNTTNDTWELPFLHGRHYASINPDDFRAAEMIKTNEGLDAYEIRYASEQEMIDLALVYYRDNYPELYSTINPDDPNVAKHLIERGLTIRNA